MAGKRSGVGDGVWVSAYPGISDAQLVGLILAGGHLVCDARRMLKERGYSDEAIEAGQLHEAEMRALEEAE